MIRVGIIGLGAMGRLHFQCWRRSGEAQIVAISSRDPRLRAGEWHEKEFNLGNHADERVDLSGIRTYERAEDLIADPAIDAVDICTSTPLHAPLAIRALEAGKHVLCEKPMALSLAECDAMEAAAAASGRLLMIGHCLRFWPHYLRAGEMIRSGEFGKVLYGRLERTGAAPRWSSGGWLMNAAESGGVLDMHIHDIDVGLWWFGKPSEISATGVVSGGLPTIIDAQWKYAEGPAVHLHSAWDRNGGEFRHAFRVVLERATITHDLSRNANVLEIWRDGAQKVIELGDGSVAYQVEIDTFARAASGGIAVPGCAPESSRAAVEVGLQELELLQHSSGGRAVTSR